MRKGRIVIGLVTIAFLALGSTAYAGEAADESAGSAVETPLEGDVLDQVVAAAVAEVGTDATVVRAETDADGNAAYEVHMVRADGSLVTVYVDESFIVAGVVDHAAQQVKDNGVDGKNDGVKKPWDEQRTHETVLEGETLDAVIAAALAEVGEDATVLRVETDADGHAIYEAHMLAADGTLVTVYVNESFAVVSVAENASPGPGWMGVLRGKLKIRDEAGEKIKYSDQVQARVHKDPVEGQDENADDDADEPEAGSANRDRDGGKDADNGGSGGKQGGTQGGSHRSGGSRR
jgi:hypothetical protein